MNRYIVSLNSKRALQAVLSGGKGADLAWLLRQRFRVPQRDKMPTRYIVKLTGTSTTRGRAKRTQNIGSKAEKLRFLNAHHFRVPATLVCTWDAFEEYQRRGANVLAAIKAELTNKVDAGRHYAVRSSANLEDSSDFSFAGQFKTVLDVEGVDGICRAIESIWATADSPSVRAYLTRHAIDPRTVRMAVLIQEMVSPVISGVAFSKNPITGMDELVVEAVSGSGEALVQAGITPQRWIYKWGEWIARPEDGDEAFGLIAEIVRQTKAITKVYGRPVDLEWVYDGRTIYWVQLREITAINIDLYSNRMAKDMLPGLIKPLVWSVSSFVSHAWLRVLSDFIGPDVRRNLKPDRLTKSFYYRAYFNMGVFGQIFEMLGLPRESLELLMGIDVAGPEKPSFTPTPRTLRLLPQLLYATLDKARLGREIEAFLPRLEERYRTFAAVSGAFDVDQVERLSEPELMAEIDRLTALMEEVAYYNILTPLTAHVHYAILKRQLTAMGADIDSLDLTRGMEGLDRYDPNLRLAELHQEYSLLDESLKAHIREIVEVAPPDGQPPAGGPRPPGARLAAGEVTSSLPPWVSGGSYEKFRQLPAEGLASLWQDVERFIAEFGHLSDRSSDFSAVPWRENPDLILKMIVDYKPPDAARGLSGQETAPGGRGDLAPTALRMGGAKVGLDELRIPLTRRFVIGPIYRQARRFTFYRQAVGFQYIYGYGLFRVYFLALGNRFVRRDLIDVPEDIFYLSLDEVRAIVAECPLQREATPLYVQDHSSGAPKAAASIPRNGGQASPVPCSAGGRGAEVDSRAIVARRRQEMEECQHVIPPEVIYGDQDVPLETLARMAGADRGSTSPVLRGTPTSRGHCTGRVKVVQGLLDFDKLQPGDVLVIPYSDVGWMPLFTRAGAIVAESGGMLSHCSIVAREYNLPAVVSVPGVCGLADDTVVSVDGFRGEIVIHCPSVEDPTLFGVPQRQWEEE